MSDLPEPLTAPEIDLQDFPFMPLQVARLRDSDLAAEEHPEACWYAVLLWAASWHQLPAGSLPDNETVLMRLCGLGRDQRTWKKHRAGALRGFVKCSDGRLYHPVVAEQAIEAWKGKLQQRWRTECARIRKLNQRNGTDLSSPTFEEFVAGDEVIPVTPASHGTPANVPRDIASKGQGQGQGQYPQAPKLDSPGPSPDLVAVIEEAGMSSIPPDHQLLADWKALGADMRQDILPIVRRIAEQVKGRDGRAPFKLKLFDAAIRQKLAEDAAEIERLQRITRRMERMDEEQRGAVQ